MRFFYRVLSSIWYSRLSLQSSLNPQRTQVRAKGMKTIPSRSPSFLLRVKIIPSYHVTPAIGHCSRFHAQPALEDRVFWRESELVINHENSFAKRVHVDVYKDFLWQFSRIFPGCFVQAVYMDWTRLFPVICSLRLNVLTSSSVR